MKKLFIFSIIFIVLTGIVAAALWNTDYGYVILSNGQWAMERSLAQFGVILVFTFILFYFIIWLLSRILLFPSIFRRYKRRKNRERAHRDIIQGLIAVIEGHPKKAERILLRNIEHSETKLLNYLLAARAAQLEEASDRRDEYLKQAYDSTPEADLAVGLTQADLQLSHNQTEQALATLSHLRDIAPKHAYVLKLLTRLYMQLDEWENLIKVLPEVRRHKLFSEEKLLEIEETVYTRLLMRKTKPGENNDHKKIWSQIPGILQSKPQLLRVYVSSLMTTKQTNEAEKVLRLALSKFWDEHLARIYGLLKTEGPGKQLEIAEGWTREHGRSPMLLLTLGRLCHRLRLWGKARVYLEASISIHPTVEAYKELGSLFSSLGEASNAARCWKEGLEFATEQNSERRLNNKALLERTIDQNEAIFTTAQQPATTDLDDDIHRPE